MSRLHVRLNTARWRAARMAVLSRDGYRCRACGGAGRLEVDHIRPLWKGGAPYGLENLQALCRRCSIEKTARENRKPRTASQRAWDALVNELQQR